MEWMRQLPWTAAPVSFLLTIFLLQCQVHCLHIRPIQCFNSMGDSGTCMFVWECIKTEGKHLGTCADGFLFGSCCAHNDSKNDIIPPIQVTTTEMPLKTFSTASMKSSTLETSYTQISSTSRPQTSFTASFINYSTKPYPKPPYFKPSTRPTSKPFTRSTSKPSTIPTSISSSRPASKATSRPTSKPTSRPTSKPSSRPTSKPSSRPTSKPSSRPTSKPSSRPTSKPFSRPMSKPSTRPTSKPSTVFDAKTTSRPTFKPSTRPTSKPSTVFTSKPTSKSTLKPSTSAIPTVLINQPVYPNTSPSSTTSSYVIRTTRPSYMKPPSNNYGQTSSTYGWYQPSSFKPPYISTKRPVVSTSVSTIHRPSVSYWTSKYPYFRPSWKPTSKPSFVPTSSRPQIFTYIADNSTRPSFTPYTSTVPYAPSPTFSTSGISSLNFTSFSMKSTTPFHTTDMPATRHSLKPAVHATTDKTSFTTSYPTNRPTTITNEWPFFSTSTKNSNQPSSTQNNWFRPTQRSTTTSRATLFTTVNQDSLGFGNISLQESFTTEMIKQPTETVSTVTSTSEDSTGLLDHVTSTNTETTTPLPVTPCGLPIPHPQKKVVGGKNSAFGSWPWQASVRRTSFFGFSSTHRCGGALVSPGWVATAGHCVDDLLLSQIKIRVGEYDFASVQEPHGYVERGVKKKVVHPRYNFFTYENDLALVELEEPINSTKHPHISPICLPPSEENLVGRNATVTGWGRLSEGGVLPSILQEVQVPIISNEKCKNMFLAAGRHEYIPDIFMCAGFEEGGRDSCQGDSGGPLQIQAEEGYWFLAGIISWGIGCAEPNMPGVCTRISKFKDWVVQQIT